MQRGQASLEYVVVVALVAVVCGLGGVAVADAAPGVVNDVARGIRRALCVVGGGDCLATEDAPCVTSTAADDETVTVHALLVRVGDHAGILREQRSDGTVAVTEIDQLSAGVAGGVGVHARLDLGRIALETGGELRAQALAKLGHGRTFHVRDARAADALMGRLAHGSPKTLVLERAWRYGRRLLGLGGRSGVPRADEVTYSAGADLAGSAELTSGSAGADGGLRAAVGARLDRRTGRRTYFFDAGGEAGGALRAAVAHGRLRAGTDLGVALTYDRAGRPLQLTVSAAGMTHDGARRLEIEDRLDLTRAGNADAAARLLRALRGIHPAAAAGAAREVAARLAGEGSIDVRAYGVSTSSDGAGGDVALGARLGAEVTVEHSATRLLGAWSRPAGGLWERRIDCLRAEDSVRP